MQLHCQLLLSILCLGATSKLFGYSQSSYFCYPAEKALPANHVCRTSFPNQTSIMVPSPRQTHHMGRNIPAKSEHMVIESIIAVSLKAIATEIAGVSYPDYCSNKILTLLCFFYFPTCFTSDNEAKTLFPPIFPCRQLCEELTAEDTECTKKVKQHLPRWGPLYDHCNYTYFNGLTGKEEPVYAHWNDTGKCVSGSHPGKCVGLDSKLPEDVEDYTSKCRGRKTRILPRVTSKQVYNTHSVFVLNCTITGVMLDGSGIFYKRAIKCAVNNFYEVKKNQTCGKTGLTAGMEVYVLGYPTDCPTKKKTSIYQTFENDSVGKTFIIAGRYYTKYCGKTYLYLTHRSIAEHDVGIGIPESIESNQCD